MFFYFLYKTKEKFFKNKLIKKLFLDFYDNMLKYFWFVLRKLFNIFYLKQNRKARSFIFQLNRISDVHRFILESQRIEKIFE